MKGKLIVIEGTDCSGKETQSNILIDRLRDNGKKVVKFSFPNYDSPTGKIVGGPYLGKDYICDGWFKEGAGNVNPKVASLYYAADRLYNITEINKALNENDIVILDRYTTSNMGHQASKVKTDIEKLEIINWLEKLEYDLLELPRPDITIFLHMPYEAAIPLRAKRAEKLDQHEMSEEHLRNAEATYLLLADKFEYSKVECAENNVARSIEDISKDIYNTVVSELNNNTRRKVK